MYRRHTKQEGKKYQKKMEKWAVSEVRSKHHENYHLFF